MSRPENPGIIARLGGRYGVSLPGLGISTVLILIAYVLGSPVDWGGNLLPKTASIILASMVVLAAVLAGNALIPRHSRYRGWLILLVFLVAGMAFGTVIGPIEVALGIADEPRFEWRIPLGTPLVAALLCLGSMQADAWLSHRDRLADIARRRAELQSAGRQADLRMIAWRSEVSDRVRTSVDEVLLGLPNSADEAVVEQLRHLAYDVIRPMSHEVASGSLGEGAAEVRALPARREKGLWTAVAGTGLPLVAYPLTIGTLGCILGVSLFGVGSGLLVGACLGASSVGAASTVRILASAGGHAAARLIAMAITVLAFAGVGSAAGLELVGPTPWAASVWLAAPLTLVIATILALDAAVQSRRRALQQRLSEVNDELAWALARVNGAFYAQRRTLTRWIHGDLQAAINAAAISIDRARRQGEGTQEAIEDGISLIVRAVASMPEASAPDLVDVLENIASTWRGTCTVTWQVDPEVITRAASQPAGATSMADILVEAVANAVRHGDASRTDITLAIKDEAAVVTVSDDGVLSQGTTGLGTRILDEVCLEWSRSAGPSEGTALRAVIPLSSVPAGRC